MTYHSVVVLYHSLLRSSRRCWISGSGTMDNRQPLPMLSWPVVTALLVICTSASLLTCFSSSMRFALSLASPRWWMVLLTAAAARSQAALSAYALTSLKAGSNSSSAEIALAILLLPLIVCLSVITEPSQATRSVYRRILCTLLTMLLTLLTMLLTLLTMLLTLLTVLLTLLTVLTMLLTVLTLLLTLLTVLLTHPTPPFLRLTHGHSERP